MFLLISGLIFLLLCISWLIVRYYSDTSSSHPLSTTTTILTLFCALLCIFIIPLDVLSVTNPLSSQHNTIVTPVLSGASAPSASWLSLNILAPNVDSGVIHTAYHALFACIGVLVLVIIPFSYFYVEDDEEEDLKSAGVISIGRNMSRKGCFGKSTTSLKNTLLFILIILILLCVIMFFKPISNVLSTTKTNMHEKQPVSAPIQRLQGTGPTGTVTDGESRDPRLLKVTQWAAMVLDEYNNNLLDRFLLLAIGVMAVIGLFNICTYTAYGMVMLPMQLIKAESSIEDVSMNVEYDLVAAQQKRQVIQNKLNDPNTSSRLKATLTEELSKLSQDNQRNVRRRERLQTMSKDWVHSLYTYIYPIRALIGIALYMASAVVVLSLFMSVIDMSLNSLCGVKCGFIVDTPKLFNPLDYILVSLSAYFPLDYVVLCLLCMYLLVCSMFGIIKLGIRIGPYQLFQIKPHRTWPQALLLLCSSLMFLLLGLVVLLLVLAPQYSSFGSQVYHTDGDTIAKTCTHSSSISHRLKDSKGNASNTVVDSLCNATQISLYIHRLLLTHPLFSVVFYGAYWCVLVVCLVMGIRLSCSDSAVAAVDDDGYDSASDEEIDIKAYKSTRELQRLEKSAFL